MQLNLVLKNIEADNVKVGEVNINLEYTAEELKVFLATYTELLPQIFQTLTNLGK